MNTTCTLSLKSAPGPSEPQKCRFTPLALPGVMLVEPKRFGDARGWFSETYSVCAFAAAGIDLHFVQDNMAHSGATGTVRGLHYQLPPFAQDKLVWVLRGCVLDVAVDMRENSHAFGKHVTAELSAENGRQLLIPAGFAHGYVTREPDTMVAYKVTSFYAPGYEHGVFWADPALGIGWGIGADEAVLSPKDAVLPAFKNARYFGAA